MEFNNNYGNQQNNNQKSITVYSPYRFNNSESVLDPTCLTFSYWKNCLKVGISPKKNNTEGDYVSFDTDNGIYVYLTHTKARILSNELKKYLEDPDKYINRGIPSGQGLITISNGKEYNIDKPVLTIRKINEAGITTSAFAYEFKSDYYYAINNYISDGSFVKVIDDYKNMEILMVIDILDSYIQAMTYAISYTVNERLNWNMSKIHEKLDALMEASGVKLKDNRSRGQFNSSSVFNNAGAGMNVGGSNNELPFESSSMDDVM